MRREIIKRLTQASLESLLQATIQGETRDSQATADSPKLAKLTLQEYKQKYQHQPASLRSIAAPKDLLKATIKGETRDSQATADYPKLAKLTLKEYKQKYQHQPAPLRLIAAPKAVVLDKDPTVSPPRKRTCIMQSPTKQAHRPSLFIGSLATKEAILLSGTSTAPSTPETVRVKEIKPLLKVSPKSSYVRTIQPLLGGFKQDLSKPNKLLNSSLPAPESAASSAQVKRKYVTKKCCR